MLPLPGRRACEAIASSMKNDNNHPNINGLFRYKCFRLGSRSGACKVAWLLDEIPIGAPAPVHANCLRLLSNAVAPSGYPYPLPRFERWLQPGPKGAPYRKYLSNLVSWSFPNLRGLNAPATRAALRFAASPLATAGEAPARAAAGRAAAQAHHCAILIATSANAVYRASTGPCMPPPSSERHRRGLASIAAARPVISCW